MNDEIRVVNSGNNINVRNIVTATNDTENSLTNTTDEGIMVNSSCGCKEQQTQCQNSKNCCTPPTPVLNCTMLTGTTVTSTCGLNSAGQLVLNFYPIQCCCSDSTSDNSIIKYTLYVNPNANTVSTTNFTMIFNISPNVGTFVSGTLGMSCFSAILTATSACGATSLPSAVFNSPGCTTLN
jgi:hypothetical protein